MKGGAMRRRFRTWLSKPAVCAGLLAACAAEAWFAQGKWPDDPTLVGGVVHRVLFPTPVGSNDSFWWDDGAAFKDETGSISVLILPPNEPMDAWINGILSEHDSVLALTRLGWTDYAGLWQYCVRIERSEIHSAGLTHPEDWSDADIARARSLFVHQILGTEHTSEFGRRLSEEDVVTARPLWLGVLNDAVSLVVLAAAIASVPLSAKHWRRLFTTRRNRRLPRGQCPSCGYDMQGIEGGVCPECGNKMEDRA